MYLNKTICTRGLS